MALAVGVRRLVFDVSSYQGVVDFNRLKADHPELVGVIIKAVEGQWDGTNPSFAEQYQSARAAGLMTGFYCFDHTSVNAAVEANLYLNKVAGLTAELGHWLDFEANDANMSPAGVQAHVQTWLQTVNAARSEPVGVYSAPWAWDPWTGQMDASAHPLWLAGYTPDLPPSPAHWGPPTLWQFTESFPTYLGNVDASVILDDLWPQEDDMFSDQDRALLQAVARVVVQLSEDEATRGKLIVHGDPTHYGLNMAKADIAAIKAAVTPKGAS